jgi:hypothetical protein
LEQGLSPQCNVKNIHIKFNDSTWHITAHDEKQGDDDEDEEMTIIQWQGKLDGSHFLNHNHKY